MRNDGLAGPPPHPQSVRRQWIRYLAYASRVDDPISMPDTWRSAPTRSIDLLTAVYQAPSTLRSLPCSLASPASLVVVRDSAVERMERPSTVRLDPNGTWPTSSPNCQGPQLREGSHVAPERLAQAPSGPNTHGLPGKRGFRGRAAQGAAEPPRPNGWRKGAPRISSGCRRSRCRNTEALGAASSDAGQADGNGETSSFPIFLATPPTGPPRGAPQACPTTTAAGLRRPPRPHIGPKIEPSKGPRATLRPLAKRFSRDRRWHCRRKRSSSSSSPGEALESSSWKPRAPHKEFSGGERRFPPVLVKNQG